MDVTQNILNNVQTYGATPSLNPAYLAASKTLDFAQGGSINNPIIENITVLPLRIGYKDAVGLFGIENAFIKLQLKLQNTNPRDSGTSSTRSFFESAVIDSDDKAIDNTFKKVIVTGFDNTGNVHYDVADINNDLAKLVDPFVSVDLTNLKTGNQYVDNHLDIQLYTNEKEPHPYSRIYLRPDDFCYISFHARKTRRLPYNIEVNVGTVYEESFDLEETEKEFLPRRR